MQSWRQQNLSTANNHALSTDTHAMAILLNTPQARVDPAYINVGAIFECRLVHHTQLGKSPRLTVADAPAAICGASDHLGGLDSEA
jgi:hypothetical protein